MDQVYGWILLTVVFGGIGFVLWKGLSETKRDDRRPDIR